MTIIWYIYSWSNNILWLCRSDWFARHHHTRKWAEARSLNQTNLFYIYWILYAILYAWRLKIVDDWMLASIFIIQLQVKTGHWSKVMDHGGVNIMQLCSTAQKIWCYPLLVEVRPVLFIYSSVSISWNPIIYAVK